MKQKWAGQVRKGDIVVANNGQEFSVVKVEPVFGGSWFNIFIEGDSEPFAFGRNEKVEVKG